MDQKAPEIIFTLMIASALFGGLGILLFSKSNLKREFRSFAMEFATIVAIGATFGSLYFSEIRDFLPCEFCWYQRIAMYPLALIVPLAIALRDRSILRYSLALGLTGLAFSLYHIQLQLFPDQGSNSCEITSPCTAKWVEAFGFMTIPQMAGTTFAIIVVVSIIGLRTPPPGVDTMADDNPSEQTSSV